MPNEYSKYLDLHQFLVAIACENASHKIFIKIARSALFAKIAQEVNF
jgi:DNA-directed RNA polymerase subunit RPC12/RpoP